MKEPVLHIVHCIDTEGPLNEDLEGLFERLKQLFGIELQPNSETLRRLQRKEIDLGGVEAEVARVVAPELLAYNRTWTDIKTMLDDAMSYEFRHRLVDDFGGGWVYSWHCVDHTDFRDNPRRKDFGYGNVFRFYRQMVAAHDACDELNWHFHPLSLTKHPLHAATSFANSMPLLMTLIARRIIDDDWFPTTNRPGFHAERPDSNVFLEQWIPYDYANQSIEDEHLKQTDAGWGRFGDWSRAPRTWSGYRPSHDDYQVPGQCRRWIFRCLNVGTRFRLLRENHVREAFTEAREKGSAILAFADHDYRDLRPDVEMVRGLLRSVSAKFRDVRFRFSGAHAAAQQHTCVTMGAPACQQAAPLKLTLNLSDNRLNVRVASGQVFGPQPFLALKTRCGHYYSDNFDVIAPNSEWTYVLDEQTLHRDALSVVAAAAAGSNGGYSIARAEL